MFYIQLYEYNHITKRFKWFRVSSAVILTTSKTSKQFIDSDATQYTFQTFAASVAITTATSIVVVVMMFTVSVVTIMAMI